MTATTAYQSAREDLASSFAGDYIYEYRAGAGRRTAKIVSVRDRRPDTLTLATTGSYGLYKSDPDLQRAHAHA